MPLLAQSTTSSKANVPQQDPGSNLLTPVGARTVLRPRSKLIPSSETEDGQPHATDQCASPSPNVWANAGSAAALGKSTASRAQPNLLKNAVAKSVHNHATTAAATGQDQLTSQMGRFNLGPTLRGGAKGFNPSEGPTSSEVSTNWRFHGKSPSQASNRSVRQAINTLVCKISGLTRRDFRQGKKFESKIAIGELAAEVRRLWGWLLTNADSRSCR